MTRHNALSAAAPALALALLAAPALAQPEASAAHVSLMQNAEAVATATFIQEDGTESGGAMLTETPNGVLLTAEITGLEPGAHGFHIHETGECRPDFQAAGGHYAPTGEPHGFATEEGAHVGDMPNIYAGQDGVARVELFLKDVTLTDGETTLLDEDGSALMVHAQPDDYVSADSAGPRSACAVIQPVTQ